MIWINFKWSLDFQTYANLKIYGDFILKRRLCFWTEYICCSFKILWYPMASRQQGGTVCAVTRSEWMLTVAPNRPAVRLWQNVRLGATLHWGSNGALILLCLHCVCVCTDSELYIIAILLQIKTFFFSCNSWCLTSFVFPPIPFRLGEPCLVYYLA